jgi:CRISPR-associated endonuclease/helicase Cas3
MNYREFFKKATGHDPYPYQERLATDTLLPELVDIPTGLGKTAAVVLAWSWRRRFAGEEIHRRTPRRLVYCLPMRVLVEQTRDATQTWLERLGLQDEVRVHVLMGGEEGDDWDLWPERDAILVGTQDMLLSRALNRGYGMSRYRWPMQFGLLHTDCLWVFDEIQLMGSGLATTAQLEAFRRTLPGEDAETAKNRHGCRSVWMSATLRRDWLKTVDSKRYFDAASRIDGQEPISLTDADYRNEQVSRRWNASKPLSRAGAAMGDKKALADEIVTKHAEHRGLTLVVVNTVHRAQEVRREIERKISGDSAPWLVLVHSRFRPPDRERNINALLDEERNRDMICVSTQVVEAGVDLDGTTLFTELAPWASLVQRFGRCNRRGERNNTARVFWVNLLSNNKDAEKVARPYMLSDLQRAAETLDGLHDVCIRSLPDVDLPLEHTHVIRRRDLIDLFDTTPDLAGNDVDIDRYVREVEETDVRVFWREWDQPNGNEAPPNDKAWRRVGRQELCPARVRDFRDFARSDRAKGKVWRWDYLSARWVPAAGGAIYPGQTFLVHVSAGGYDTDVGWIGTTGSSSVLPLGPIATDEPTDDAYDDDGLSKTGQWQTIAEHTSDVCHEVKAIIRYVSLPAIEAQALLAAARWHDWGKAHDAFRAKLKAEAVTASHLAEKDRHFVGKAPGGAWWTLSELRKQVRDPASGVRIHFRHELASALGVLLPDTPVGDVNRDLVAYLIAAHHGKVRLSIRSMPNETRLYDEDRRPQPGERFARGVWDGDPLPNVDLGGGVTAPYVTLSLEPMGIGLCEGHPFDGQPSWLERTLRLRDTLGPFRLAYLEALLRAADWRASAALVHSGGQPAPAGAASV